MGEKRLICSGSRGAGNTSATLTRTTLPVKGPVMAEANPTPVVADSQTVEYRDIPGFPGYCAGSDGSIWSAWLRFYQRGVFPSPVRYVIGEGRVKMKTRETRSGYLDVELRKGNKSIHLLVHRLILLAFAGNPPTEQHECAHWNGVRSDNRIANLRWATKTENQADRFRHGTRLLKRKRTRAS